MKQVTRRDFIRYALVGAAAFGSGFAVDRYAPFMKTPRLGGRYHLAMTEALVEMVDRTPVYHWAFEDLEWLRPMPQVPGPLIDAIEGEVLEFSITNNLPDVHGFRIPGVPGIVGEGIVIEPGETAHFSFTVPEGGSYLYYDHLNPPVNRVLGLNGPMVVLPKNGNTPYSRPTPAVQELFNDLGTSEHFPGEPWKPERTRIWLFSTVDPVLNGRVERGERLDHEEFIDT
ncbi:MAG: multicopper oxidase domain-containing protein, partial [Dehalococcoidales bacterium]|nr:multicopper oxidase domain-containing protein [Dehalococcoidales bacterium]